MRYTIEINISEAEEPESISVIEKALKDAFKAKDSAVIQIQGYPRTIGVRMRCPRCGEMTLVYAEGCAKARCAVGYPENYPGYLTLDWEGDCYTEWDDYNPSYFCDECGELLFTTFSELEEYYQEQQKQTKERTDKNGSI